MFILCAKIKTLFTKVDYQTFTARISTSSKVVFDFASANIALFFELATNIG